MFKESIWRLHCWERDSEGLFWKHHRYDLRCRIKPQGDGFVWLCWYGTPDDPVKFVGDGSFATEVEAYESLCAFHDRELAKSKLQELHKYCEANYTNLTELAELAAV